MPGMRDKNLRSGDLHEELGLFLLKAIALVAPVPRQEDVGNDAFATLIRPDGNRRLIPDLSFLVQLKSESVTSVSYTTANEMAWIRALEAPLFIGRVSLKQACIELFTTTVLQQILLNNRYDSIELLLDESDDKTSTESIRRANLGPPIHIWSISEIMGPDFLTKSHAIIRPHIENLRQNRSLREIQTYRFVNWQTGRPPIKGAEMVSVSSQTDIGDTLREMAPHVRRLFIEMQSQKRYGDFHILLAFIDLMRRWGVDPDSNGAFRSIMGMMAGGPEVTVEEAINIRSAFQGGNALDLRELVVTDLELVFIPDTVYNLSLVNSHITDAGIPQLLRLSNLMRINLAGTQITDTGFVKLSGLKNLQWVCVNRTRVSTDGILSLKSFLPNVEILHDTEP